MQLSSKFRTVLLFVLILLLLLVGWFIGKDWLRPNIIKLLGGFTQSEVKMTRDTLDIKYKDIYIKYKELETKATDLVISDTIFKYKYIPIHNTKDPSTMGKTPPQYIEIQHAKRYVTSINDTILDGNIETILDIDSCKIVSQSLKYTPKIPYIREKIITIVETKETILSQEPKARLGAGMDANLNKEIIPKIYYLTKKNWLYNGGYTKSLDPTRPDTFTIGIAKLF